MSHITTIACSIGKHELCNGTGHADSTEGKTFACDCLCHHDYDVDPDADDYRTEARKEEG